jgi:hypothetical protein
MFGRSLARSEIHAGISAGDQRFDTGLDLAFDLIDAAYSEARSTPAALRAEEPALPVVPDRNAAFTRPWYTLFLSVA